MSKDIYHHHYSLLRVRIYNIIIVPPYEEGSISSSGFLLARKGLYHHQCSSLQGKYFWTTPRLSRKFGQHISNLIISTHILEFLFYSSLLYHIPYIKVSDFYMLWFIMEHRILYHLYVTLIVTKNYCGVQIYVK